jgi:hypothetical protein
MSGKFRLAKIAIVFGAVCTFYFGAGNPALAQSEGTLREEFRNPGKQYRPMVRWWWPGNDVTDTEIQREVGILDAHGFGGAEIQPFVTFDTRTMPRDQAERINGFATPGFFAHVRTAADAAKAHGMWIDYTFGTGWPFGGGATITPELSSLELRQSDTILSGPQKFSGQIIVPKRSPGFIESMQIYAGMKPEWPAGWEERFEARSKIIAVVAVRSLSDKPHAPKMLDSASIIVLTDRMKPDGTLTWEVPAGTWNLFVFRQFPTRQTVMGASGTGPQLVLDHFSKAAFDAHAARVGDPLAQTAANDLGSSLRAIFCDSLEVQQNLAWSDDFLEQFKIRRGYDLTPYLEILRQPGYNDFYFSRPGGMPIYDMADGDAIRADYWKTVSDLIFENFYHPFDLWAMQHKMLSRVQAHGAPADLLRTYGDASIPETEELDGGNTINFMKLASSAGYDYGRRIVSSESFVFRGNPYVTTPESIKANSDKLFVSGINEIIYHGFPYKYADGTAGIGWFPFQGQFSSQINETNPIWPFIGKINDYITRLQFITQRGASDLQVAIYRSALNEDDMGPASGSGPAADPFPAIEKSLTASGYSFGFVNEAVLTESSARTEVLTTKAGGRYRALLIPHETNISPDVATALERFAAGRLPLIFVGGMPGADAGFKNLGQGKEYIATVLQKLHTSVEEAANGEQAATQLAAKVEPQIHFAASGGLPFVKKTIGSTRFYLLANPTGKTVREHVGFEEKSAPQQWNPWTGKVEEVLSFEKDGHTDIDVELPPFGSALYAFDSTRRLRADVPLEHTEVVKQQSVGETGWSVDAKGDSEKGVGIEVHLKLDRLVDWLNNTDLRTFSGVAVYTTHLTVAASDLKASSHILIDLGEVKDAAQVKINGKPAATLVVHPFAADIRSFLHAGDNTIEISVSNSLTNYVSTIHWPKPMPNAQEGHFPPVSAGLLGTVVIEYQKVAAR